MAQAYSDADQEAALRVLDRLKGDFAAASRETGIKAATLKRWHNARPEVRAGRLHAQSLHLQETLLDSSQQIVKALAGQIDGAPLNQLTAALGVMVDRFLKLDEYTQRMQQTQGEQTIRVEYLYPDGSIHGTPPWSGADSEREGAVSGKIASTEAAMDGAICWWLDPTYTMAMQVWRDLKVHLRHRIRGLTISESDHRIDIPGAGSIVSRSRTSLMCSVSSRRVTPAWARMVAS